MVALASLSPSIVGADAVNSREEYIVNGQPVAPDGLRGTVMVTFLDADTELDEITPIALRPFPYCSGVLIAPTVVLTAAHCLEDCGWDTCSQPDGETSECLSCEPELRAASSIYVTPGVRTVDDLRRAEPVPVRQAFVPEGYTSYPYWTTDGGECEPYGDGYLCTEPGLSSEMRSVPGRSFSNWVAVIGGWFRVRAVDRPGGGRFPGFDLARQRLVGKQIERRCARIVRERLENRQVVAKALSRGGRVRDDQMLAARRELERTCLVTVQLPDATLLESPVQPRAPNRAEEDRNWPDAARLGDSRSRFARCRCCASAREPRRCPWAAPRAHPTFETADLEVLCAPHCAHAQHFVVV